MKKAKFLKAVLKGITEGDGVGVCPTTRLFQPDIRITNTPFSVESAAAVEGNYGADRSGADGDKSVGGGADFVTTSAVTAAGSESGTDSSEYEYYYVEYEYTTEEGESDSANEIMGDDELEETDDDEIRGGNILGLGGDISDNSVYSDDVFESPKQGCDSVFRKIFLSIILAKSN